MYTAVMSGEFPERLLEVGVGHTEDRWKMCIIYALFDRTDICSEWIE